MMVSHVSGGFDEYHDANYGDYNKVIVMSVWNVSCDYYNKVMVMTGSDDW
jgi:hypothetical protein